MKVHRAAGKDKALTKYGSQFSEPGARQLPGSLEELCALAARLFSVDAAGILIKRDGISRLVAGHGLNVPMRSHGFDFGDAPYKPGESWLLPNASGDAFVSTLAREFGLSDIGAFLRIPVEIGNEYTVSLMLFGKKPIPKPTERKLKLLYEVADLAREEFKSTVQILADPDNDITVTRSLAEIKVMIRNYPKAAYLLDDKLRVIESNEQGAGITGRPLGELIGLTHADLSEATADSVHFLYRRALETKISPPDFEIILDGAGKQRIFRINVTPFSPTDTRDYFLFVTAEETTSLAKRTFALDGAISEDMPANPPKDPSQLFLIDTLVRRRSIRQRKTANYLVLRAWRQSIKPYQITALKALKQNIPQEFPASIATEIADEVNALFGSAGFKAIVPMPCGHSRADSCLSLEIARALGLITGLPVIQAFLSEPVKGVSHPKENLKRPPLKLARVINEPVLLVDDVATSGAHIEEAVKLLKPACGAVLPIAWIGGDSAENDET
jgi:PAS domain-containing protein